MGRNVFNAAIVIRHSDIIFNFINHMRAHAGEKTHSCNHSDKYFSLNSILIDAKHHYTVGPTKFLKVVKNGQSLKWIGVK